MYNKSIDQCTKKNEELKMEIENYRAKMHLEE